MITVVLDIYMNASKEKNSFDKMQIKTASFWQNFRRESRNKSFIYKYVIIIISVSRSYVVVE